MFKQNVSTISQHLQSRGGFLRVSRGFSPFVELCCGSTTFRGHLFSIRDVERLEESFRTHFGFLRIQTEVRTLGSLSLEALGFLRGVGRLINRMREEIFECCEVGVRKFKQDSVAGRRTYGFAVRNPMEKEVAFVLFKMLQLRGVWDGFLFSYEGFYETDCNCDILSMGVFTAWEFSDACGFANDRWSSVTDSKGLVIAHERVFRERLTGLEGRSGLFRKLGFRSAGRSLFFEARDLLPRTEFVSFECLFLDSCARVASHGVKTITTVGDICGCVLNLMLENLPYLELRDDGLLRYSFW